jgi:uncharacterized membrane protein YgdD (TMEM256/DUF423 family)
MLAARRVSALAAVLLALATIIGAVATHVLRARLSAERYEIVQTAVHYQFFHALGLLALGVLLDRSASRTLRFAAWLLTAGIVLFSGSLYLLVAGSAPVVGLLTPLGGLALIVGWCLVAFALLRASERPPPP